MSYDFNLYIYYITGECSIYSRGFHVVRGGGPWSVHGYRYFDPGKQFFNR